MTGRISLLVSKDLQTLVHAANSLEPEVAAQLRAHTRANVEPIWKSELAQRTGSRFQNRVLVDTARVSVTNTQVTVKAAAVGKVGRGKTPADRLKGMAEFGVSPNKKIRQRSRKGKVYERRIGNGFPLPRRKGHVFFPAVADSAPRLASLWMQTAVRTVAETFEKVGA